MGQSVQLGSPESFPTGSKALTGRDGCVRNVCHVGGAAGDMRHDVRILTQPAVASDFEEVGTFARIGNQDSSQEVTGVRGDIFGESEGRSDDVLVKEVDIVAVRVGWVIIERQIACEHGVLNEAY